MASFVDSFDLTEKGKETAKEFIRSCSLDSALEIAYGLKTGQILPKQLAKMDKIKNNVFAISTLDEVKKKTESLYTAGMENDYIFTEGVYTCGRCKSTKIWYKEKQTRAADEAATTFFVCAKESCGNSWRT
jgi:DNA-directed RNA polymerase subunit M/transcription elongation factor TFIIS